jgi:hypothetical protein
MCHTYTVHRSATQGCQRRVKSTDTPQMNRSKLPSSSLALCWHSLLRWKTYYVPPVGLLHVRLLSPHTCNTAAMKHSRNKAILVLDFYFTELDARALEEASGSIERPTSAMAMVTSNTSTGCSLSDSTLIQTTTASNNQIAGCSDGHLGRSILVKGCGVFP